MKNKMRGPAPPCGLSRARFLGGVKGGKEGGFTSDSSNTPLGRRITSSVDSRAVNSYAYPSKDSRLIGLSITCSYSI